MLPKAIITILFLSFALYAEKADVVGAKLIKSFGDSYVAFVKVAHNDKGYEDFFIEWDIVDKNGTIITRRLQISPSDKNGIIESDLYGFRLPEGIKEIKIRAKCSKDGYGGKEYTLKIPEDVIDNNESKKYSF